MAQEVAQPVVAVQVATVFAIAALGLVACTVVFVTSGKQRRLVAQHGPGDQVAGRVIAQMMPDAAAQLLFDGAPERIAVGVSPIRRIDSFLCGRGRTLRQ